MKYLNERDPFKLMVGRLGIFNQPSSGFRYVDPNIDGVQHQATRLEASGGALQQDRMIRDKRKSLDRALKYSYQGAWIRKVSNKKPVRALINPDKLKQNYDDKILSTWFESDLQAGDVFEWLGTNSYWLVYLQELTELAYFRSEIRRCSYEIEWTEDGQKKSTFAAVRGPIETKINSFTKQGNNYDTPNYSLNILMPGTEENIQHFQRYTKFYLGGDQLRVCWRVEAADWISTPGVLQINAVEYYRNEQQDELDTIGKPIDPNLGKAEAIDIAGETFIKPRKTYEYRINLDTNLDWFVDKKYPVKLVEDDKVDYHKVTLQWMSNYSGQFELCYGNKETGDAVYKKTIVVESLF